MAGDPDLPNAEIVLLLRAGVLTLSVCPGSPVGHPCGNQRTGQAGQGRRTRLACGGCLALLNTCVRFDSWHTLECTP